MSEDHHIHEGHTEASHHHHPSLDEEHAEVDIELPEGIRLADDSLGGGYFYVASDLLVAEDDVRAVNEALNPTIDHLLSEQLAPLALSIADQETFALGLQSEPEPIADTGVVRLHIPEPRIVAFNDDEAAPLEVQLVPRLVTALRTTEHLHVSPNYAFYVSSHHRGPKLGLVPQPPGQTAIPTLPTGNGQAGAGVRVAVLDSGVAEHPLLDGHVQHMRPGGADVDSPTLTNKLLSPAAGHGTFIAGIVLEHAPGATVLARRVMTPDGFVTDSELATALQELPDDIDVLCLSFGGPTHDNLPPLATTNALQKAFEKNPRMVVVAAAGNEALDRPIWPAAFKRVIAVAALDPELKPACFSNRGWWVDACASGVDAQSAFFFQGPDEMFKLPIEPLPEPCSGAFSQFTPLAHFEGWAFWSGTSFAVPRVAGAIAATIDKASGIHAPEAAFSLINASDRPRLSDYGTVVTPHSYYKT